MHNSRTACAKREEVRGRWGKLHNKEIVKSKFCCLTDIIRVIELRRSKWVEHVECMGKIRAGFFSET